MYEIFLKLIKDKGIKASDVAKATGIPENAFTYWKSGRSVPKTDRLQKIADFLEVPLEYLTTGKDPRTQFFGLTEDETEQFTDMFALYRELSPEDRLAVIALMEKLAK